MVEVPESPENALSVSDLLAVDKICRQFEAELKAGKSPQIDAFLGDIPEPQRSQLRDELETVQGEYGRKETHRVTLAQFVQGLVSSELMTDDQLQTILNGLSANEQPEAADDLAKLLHSQGHLTRFQARAVYQGKTRGLVLGNYVILDKIGRGGMGQVFKARHRRMERVVALKMLPTAAMRIPEAVKRFQREAKAAAKLSHVNIVTAHDADEANGVHFLVMEHVQGQDLALLVKEQGPLSLQTAVDDIIQAARGLEYAHRHGVVHRDIKPSNILVDTEGVVKVLDMGLARMESGTASDDALTQTGQVMGTLDFMSPEQALDTRNVDGRTDIYSLGCTLYYLLTAQAPYGGDTMTKKILAHRQDPIPSLRAARSDVPEVLDAVCQQMLAKEPDQRQASMAEVIEQLSRCGIAEKGGPPPIPPRTTAVAETQSGAADSIAETSVLDASDISLKRSVVTPDEARGERTTVVSEAIDRLAHQDYAGVIDLLDAIPPDKRSEEADQLLKQAQGLQAKVDDLNERMTQAVRDRQFGRLREDVLENLLEIDPGNIMARDLYERLGTYGPDEKHRFDDAGMLLPAHSNHWWIDRLARLLYERINRRNKYRRKAPGRRAQGEPATVRDGRSKTPLIAAGLAVLVVAVLLLLIVFLSSDKGQMVSVKIDEALLSDPNATVWLDGEQMEIADVGDTIELKPGEHRYEIRRGDEVIVIRGFKVEEGEPFVLQISAEAHQSLMNLAQRKTELWLEKGVFGPKDDMYWEDSGVYAQDDQSSSVQFTSMDVVKELMPAFLDSIDGVALGPHSARCQINGSIGLIVWDGSVQFRTRDGQSAGSTGVGIAIPRDGQWKEIAGVMGDWRLGPSDRYDPSNDDHVALQRLLDQAGEAMVRKDAEAIRRLSHPDWRGFIEGDDGPQVITSEAYTQENLHGMAVDKHQHTITNVKIDGPLAISLSQLDQIVDGRPVIAQGHLNFYARTKEGWRFLAWVAGDWTSVLTGRKGQGTSSPPLEPGFVSLFDGETLNGWEGDKTHYFVQDGLLVSDFGEQMFLDKSGGNLLTSREYGDFTLRLEFRLQPGANSGVLIRSSSSGQPKRDGMEIQVIDDSDPEFAEILRAKPYQRTASLSPVAPAQSGKLEPVGSWNELEITCQGRQLTVRLNASTVLDVNLDSFQGKAANGQDCPGLSRIRGRIGLLGFASRRRVEYRNIRIKELTPVPNQQLEPGFVSLFDGKTLVGWETWRVTGRNMEDPRQVPGGWDVQDGMLVCTSDQAGWLKSSRHYGDFVLQLEYKLPTGGNSGIFIRCPAAGHLSMQGMEIQIIDEQGQAFSPVRQEMRTGAIAHVVGPPRLSSAAKPPGEWNSVEIRCEGDQVQVSLNGISVVDASMMEFEELRTRPRSGFIGLSNWQGQARGTAFRNIRIKELTTSSASPTEPGFVSLFDGKTLNGWHGDPLLWRVVDGTIVGNTKGVEFDVHSYLCTEKKYRDFVLKVKFKLHEGNSGIQFRSEQLPDYIAAGYQAEIGWASTRKRPNEAMSLFFQGLSRPAEWMDRGELLRLVNEKDWNEYVITCRGRHITIQLNGRTTVDFMEDQPAAEEGVIGFQIMRRPEMGFADMKVEFKDIRIKELADLQDEQTEAGSGIRRGGRSESPRNRGLRKQALENRGLR